MPERYIWKALLLSLIIAVGYLALTPEPPADIESGWDKLNHALGFTALAFCGSMAYPPFGRSRVLVPSALLAFGGLIEVLQLFVPGRSSEWGDVLADCVGIACGVLIAASVLRMVALRSMRR